MSGCVEFLSDMISQYPDLASSYSSMSELYVAKHWHQLTLLVYSFFKDAGNLRDGNSNFVRLYDSFVCKFDSKINQLMLSKIACLVANSYDLNDLTSRSSLLESLLEKRNRLGDVASLYLDMNLLQTSILRENSVVPNESDFDPNGKTLQSLKQGLKQLNNISSKLHSQDTSCHSSYYKAACLYYSRTKDYTNYYKSAINYLSYANLAEMPAQEKAQIARDLCDSALASEDVYNFGELLMLPVLDALKGTQEYWRVDLISAFARGDVNG